MNSILARFTRGLGVRGAAAAVLAVVMAAGLIPSTAAPSSALEAVQSQ